MAVWGQFSVRYSLVLACLFSSSIDTFQMHSISCWVLICCTCHFQHGSLFFVYFGFLCLQISSVSNFYPTQGGEAATCSVVLLGGRDTASKYCWQVWEVLAVEGPHWVCLSPRQCVCPQSTLLRLQVSLKGHCPKCALCFMHFQGLSF